VSGPDGVSKELIAAWDPFHPTVEELRVIRTQLLMRWFNPRPGRRTLAITSASPREGRSFIAANLAVVYSQLGQRTLLIDADFRAPAPAEHLQRAPTASACPRRCRARRALDRAAGDRASRACRCCRRGRCRPNPLELLSRASFAALLAKAQCEYDIIIIDTPPLGLYADAQCVAFRAGRRAAGHPPAPDAPRRHRARGARADRTRARAWSAP
jgi:Mrp family chromosome partitioning ATPase